MMVLQWVYKDSAFEAPLGHRIYFGYRVGLGLGHGRVGLVYAVSSLALHDTVAVQQREKLLLIASIVHTTLS